MIENHSGIYEILRGYLVVGLLFHSLSSLPGKKFRKLCSLRQKWASYDIWLGLYLCITQQTDTSLDRHFHNGFKREKIWWGFSSYGVSIHF